MEQPKSKSTQPYFQSRWTTLYETCSYALFIQAHADEAGDAKRRLERTEKLVMELKAQNAAVVAKLDQILGKLGSG